MKFFKKAIAGNDIFRVLQIRPFTYLMLSEFFSQLAFNMQHFVLIFIIYALTHSSTAVSGIILSFTIPAVFFSLISGVFVDRWRKRNVLLYANLFRGVLLLLFLIPNLHIGFIYFFTFLIAIATQFFLPAEAAIIPNLVGKKLILSANAIFSLGIYGTIITGYILAGPMLLLLGKTYTIVLLALLFFLSTFFIMSVKISDRKKINKKQSYNSTAILSFVREIKEIFHFIRRVKKVMHALVVLTIAEAVMFIFAVLGPGYVATVLNVKIESLSWIVIAPAALGMGFGAILLGSIGKKFKSKTLGVIGFITSGLIFILFPVGKRINGFLPHIFEITILQIVVVLAFIVGFAISLVFIPSNATIQIETNEEMRGRIYGFLNALVGAVSFIPVVIAGGLADLFGVGTVITAVGFLMIIISGMIFAFD